MKNIIIFTLLMSFYSATGVSAEVVEAKDMGQMLALIKLEKKQMENIVDKLEASGRISATHAIKAKREIASVKEEDVDHIKLRLVSLISAKQKD
jgi:hypothetical protein